MKLRLATVGILMLAIAAASLAQNPGNEEKAADRTLRGSGRVNPSTLAMEFELPLGSYPGRGIDVPISLSYSSKLWRMRQAGAAVVGQTMNERCAETYDAVFAEKSVSGWTTSLATPYVEYVGMKNLYDQDGSAIRYDAQCVVESTGYAYVRRILVHLPSGESHEMQLGDTHLTYSASSNCTGQGYCDPNEPSLAENWDGIYYATDGSNLVYVQNSSSETYKLRLPDGSYYDFDSGTDHGQDRKATQFSDRNGNSTAYTPPSGHNGYWTDTLGRTLPIPLPAAPTPTTSSSPQIYSLPGLNDSSEDIIYKFHWKLLKGNTAGESALTNFSDALRYAGDSWPCGPKEPCTVSGDSLFNSEWQAIVLAQEGFLFNPVLLTKIELPTGQSYEFSYDIYGRINRVVYPTGGIETFQYDVVESLGWLQPDNVGRQTNHGVVSRNVYRSASDSPYTWGYTAGPVSGEGYVVSVDNPDDTATERYLHRNWQETLYGFDTILAGMPYEERVYNSQDQIVSLQRTTWTKSVISGSEWHPRVVSTETTSYVPSGAGVRAVTSYEYEGALNQRDLPVLRKSTRQFGFSAVSDGGSYPRVGSGRCEPEDPCDPPPTPSPVPTPSATPLRITESKYLIYDSEYSSVVSNYTSQNMVGLVTASTVKNGAGTIVNRSVAKYDESGSSPGYRGNPTSLKSWDSTKGNSDNASAYITTTAKFDSYGNQYEATDARNCTTQTQFSSTYSYAFPTQVTTCQPSDGEYGSDTPFTTTATFDLDTGLPLTTTDANGLKIKIDYDEDTLRPRFTRRYQNNTQVGGTDETIYNDQAGNTWVTQKVQIDDSNFAETKTHFDGLGRAWKTEKTYSEGNVFVLTCYDAAGRVSKTSNPLRNLTTQDCGTQNGTSDIFWTTNTFDTAGRPWKVTTPDSAFVETLYSVSTTGEIGTVVTVKDQASKERRSITNALGNLIRVDEPTSSGLGTVASPTQPTAYTYDVLNNLLTVTQSGSGTEQCGPSGGSCSQTRTFTYDSLSRLKTATNPELGTSPTNGTITYSYDDNGSLISKVDPRGVTTSYQYDSLNRVYERSYSGESGYTTPTVNYYYDNLTNAKGKLIKVSSSVSTTEYTNFDILGRVTGHKQTTDGGPSGGYATAYAYNVAGALTEETYPSGRVVKNVLDQNGDLSIVQSKKNATAGFWHYADAFTYSAAGAVTSMQLGNGRWESTQFNSRLQPTQIALGTTSGTTDRLKLDYSYGTTANNGNLLSQTITVPMSPGESDNSFTAVQTYAYDSLNRLQSTEEKPDGWSNCTSDPTKCWKQTFKFDRYGNRNFDQSNTTMPASFSNPAVTNPTISTSNNRITSSGWTYDAAGNTLTDANGQSYVYDGENKQVRASNGSGLLGEYWYDGDGKRVKKYVPPSQNDPGETTIFVYDAAGKLIGEYSTVVAAAEDARVAYLTADHLGSPRINTDRDGKVTSRHDYHPYGEEIITAQRTSHDEYTPDSVRKQFTGYERDNETDLDFAQARMHSYTHGRFSSPDPVLSSGTLADPQTWNRYPYVVNNPMRFMDPTGMFIWTKKLGGDAEDSELEDRFTDEANSIQNEKKRRKALKKVGKRVADTIKRRNQIRAAIAAAKSLATSDRLSASQKSEVKRSIDAYGEEGDDNNVIVGQQAGRNGSAMFGEDGRIIVWLGVGNNTQETAIQFLHEGSHLADNIAFNAGAPGSDVTQLATETRAWTLAAHAAMGFGMDDYPSSLPKKLRVWRKGWTAADIPTRVANRLAGSGYGLNPLSPGDRLSTIKQNDIQVVKSRNSLPEWQLY